MRSEISYFLTLIIYLLSRAPSGHVVCSLATCPRNRESIVKLSIPMPPNLLRLKTGGKRQYHHGIKYLFRYIISRYQPGTTFELSPSELAPKFGVTERTIRNWLNYYVKNHYIFPVDRKGGRGKHSTFYLYWGTQYEHQETRKQKVKREELYSRTDLHQRCRSGDISTYQGRMEVLRALPDHVILLKGHAYYRWAMEAFRRTIVRACPWAEREVSDVICDGIGRWIEDRQLGVVRAFIRAFMAEVHTFVLAVGERLAEGVREAFRTVVRLLRKVIFGKREGEREAEGREQEMDLRAIGTIARVFSEGDRRIGRGPVHIGELFGGMRRP